MNRDLPKSEPFKIVDTCDHEVEIPSTPKEVFIFVREYLGDTYNNRINKSTEFYEGYKTALEDFTRKFLGRISKLKGDNVPEAKDESPCVKCNSSIVHDNKLKSEIEKC